MSGTDRLRLLVVSPVFPYPLVAGGKLRTYHLLRELSREFEVTLLTLADAGDATSESVRALSFVHDLVVVPLPQHRAAQMRRLLANAPRWLLGVPAEVLVKRSPGMRRELRRLLSAAPFDCVQMEYAQTIQYADVVWPTSTPTVLVAHDVSYVSQRRKAAVRSGLGGRFWSREARLMKRHEIRGWRRFHRIVAMSEVDRREILSALPDGQVDVVPNGVDLHTLTPRTEGETPTLVYVGWMRHLPNCDALDWFLRSMWPRIRAEHGSVRFRIVGKNLPGGLRRLASGDDRVDYLGHVPDIGDTVGSSWLSVVPLRIGSGSRLKILESMALGTPVVTTAIGCEGIAAEAGEHVLVSDTPAEFTQAVLQALASARLRSSLAQRGRALVEERYGWDRIGVLARETVQKATQMGSRTPGTEAR